MRRVRRSVSKLGNRTCVWLAGVRAHLRARPCARAHTCNRADVCAETDGVTTYGHHMYDPLNLYAALRLSMSGGLGGNCKMTLLVAMVMMRCVVVQTVSICYDHARLCRSVSGGW